MSDRVPPRNVTLGVAPGLFYYQWGLQRRLDFLREYEVDLDIHQGLEDASLQTAAQMLMIQDIALVRCFEEMLELRGKPGEELNRELAFVRLIVLAKLSRAGLWSEPWLDLIDQDFPVGPTPSDPREELRSQAQAADDILRQHEEIYDELHQSLFDCDYPTQRQDKVALLLLASVVFLHRRLPRTRQHMDGVLEWVQPRASLPDHRVWADIVRKHAPVD